MLERSLKFTNVVEGTGSDNARKVMASHKSAKASIVIDHSLECPSRTKD